MVVALLSIANIAYAQKQTYADTHPYTPVEGYTVPDDRAVLEKLDEWQDLKFGVLMCWGVYSIPGIVESWALCSEDETWEYPERQKKGMTMAEFRKWYWGLSEVFNPVKFDPDKWADIMGESGAKYLVFTSKHHDGFCLFDTKYTDYSVKNTPFGSNPKYNVLDEVFKAFRQKDFMIGCYFSKPDWHCPYYWNPLFDAGDRNYNYDVKKHPDWQAAYAEFTRNQLAELTTEYGNIDILWLDGGQVDGSEFGLDEVLADARKRNPGMISVDRARRNPNENYLTPECHIPDVQMNVPWETCDPLASWGWVYNPHYKSSTVVIANMIEIVAKGGNYLLGIGPDPWGEIDSEARSILSEIGAWLSKNGKAIYNTRITEHYNDGKVWFNADKNGRTLYALYSYSEDDGSMPGKIEWTGNVPTGKMTLLSTGKPGKYTVSGDHVTGTLPNNHPAESFALSFDTSD